MRKTAIMTIGLLLTGLAMLAQTKTFTGSLEDYTCGDTNCSFGIKKADGDFYDENITLEYDSQGKTKLTGEFQDVVIKNGDNESLNPKYQGKKVTLTCSVKNNVYYVNKIEEAGKAASEASIDDFKKATCKVYNSEDGRLRNVCENQTVYKISRDGIKDNGKPIQNKNELCRGSKCIKVKIDAAGFITLYTLPNTTEGRIVGKVVGDKIYSCDMGKKDKLSFAATFKGDKNTAALIAAYEQFYR